MNQETKKLTTREYVKKVAAELSCIAHTSYDTDEDIICKPNELKRVKEILEKSGFKVSEPEKITLNDIKGFEKELDILGITVMKVEQQPLELTLEQLKQIHNWVTVHVHAPHRKEKSWSDRGWEWLVNDK